MKRLTCGLIFAAGCAAHSHSASTLPVVATGSTTGPATGPALVRMESQKGSFRFAYPASWHPVMDDTVVTLVPAGESAIGRHTLAVDVPDLPWHIPGLIPLVLVEGGFVDDLRKRYKQVVVTVSTSRTVDGEDKGREVHATGLRDGGEVDIFALLVVHGDQVYVVDAETDAPGAAAALKAFDTVVGSIKWMD